MQPPILIRIDVSEHVFDEIADYFRTSIYPIRPKRRGSNDTDQTLDSAWPDLMQHTLVYRAASQLDMPVLKQYAMKAYSNALDTWHHDLNFYINSAMVIYDPDFDAHETRLSIPGPPPPQTMKWSTTYGLVEFLPYLFRRHPQMALFQTFCKSNGEFCHDLMAAVGNNPRMNGVPITSVIKCQVKDFAFKTRWCNNLKAAYESLERVMESMPEI